MEGKRDGRLRRWTSRDGSDADRVANDTGVIGIRNALRMAQFGVNHERKARDERQRES